MANIKITDLNAYSDPASTDVLPIVDVGADETKKVSIADLMENAGAGTEALPGIAFNGDPNTGIYSPGADTVGVSTAGTERMRITSAGNVGIGTSSPQELLHLSGSGTQRLRITETGSTLFTQIVQTSSNTGIVAAAPLGLSNELSFSTTLTGSSFERMRIDSAGNVGIGTTSPVIPLDVNTGAAGAPTVGFGQSSSDPFIHLERFTGVTDYDAVRISAAFGSAQGGVLTISNGTGATKGQQTFTERLRINSAGNVGIGTSSPQQKLHVSGTVSGAIASIETTGTTAGLTFKDSGTGGNYPRVASIGNVLALRGGATNDSLFIDPSGKVGIGTSSPSGTLDVAGQAIINDSGSPYFTVGLTVGNDIAVRSPDSNPTKIHLLSNTNHGVAEIAANGDNTTGYISFATRNSGSTDERMRITSAGRVGIGTPSPWDKLEIRDGGVVVGFSDNVTRTNKLLSGYGTEAGGALYGNVSIRSDYNSTTNSSTLSFHTALGAGADTERLRISNAGVVTVGSNPTTPAVSLDPGTTGSPLVRDSSGRVGVGTATPAASFHAAGAIPSAPNGNGFMAGAGGGGYGQAKLYGSNGGILDFGAPGGDATARIMASSSDAALQFHSGGPGALLQWAGISSTGVFTVGATATPGVSLDPGTTGSPLVRDSQGRVGIGVASPGAKLDVDGGNVVTMIVGGDSTASGRTDAAIKTGRIAFPHYTNAEEPVAGVMGSLTGGNSAVQIGGGSSLMNAATVLQFYTAGNTTTVTGTERLRITSAGKLLVGTSTDDSGGLLQVRTNSSGDERRHSFRSDFNQAGYPALINLDRSIGNGAVANDSYLGYLAWRGHDGTGLIYAASISGEVDGTPGTNDMPGRLVFSTTPDGLSSPLEAMRIDQSRAVLIGRTAYTSISTNGHYFNKLGWCAHSVDQDAGVYVNRNVDDGYLVRLYQAGTMEGNISVSGTTVSYNGGHLSRWSQLPGGVERTEILRGSVLSNIDEMCEWGDEENEQLNRMKVSDIEGDRNVAGVFQSWDDEDDTYTNDFFCAMTGDFVIRIGAGVTVERGDLLMSAGDGTAKPQDDDIIRSKTIAKVTSTNVSCTYDDGSYCVPCVLMAC